MAPPLPTLSTTQFSASLGLSSGTLGTPGTPGIPNQINSHSNSNSQTTLDALAHCPLKTIPQYDCVSKQYLIRRQAEADAEQASSNSSITAASPAAQSLQGSRAAQPAPRTRASTRPELVCHEFLRYFRRCADLPPPLPGTAAGNASFRANVEVTALMGVRRSASITDDGGDAV